jgi:hypothetical protein
MENRLILIINDFVNYWVMHPVARDALRRRQLLLTLIYRNILYFHILDFRVCFFDADLYID